ncbi:dCTP deaminase, dUMP-forming [uncultured archaeon]|nr:dCTP deaminase, dUMP-forming [uncultured archaeon]
MVLSDRDIKARLKKGDFKIAPLELSAQLGTSSIDLRLGTRFRTFKTSNQSAIDPTTFNDKKIAEWEIDGAKVEEYEYSTLLISEKPFVLHPGEFVLASLMEHVEMPVDLVGRLEGRSSLGRLGLQVHSTAGVVDAGYKGYLTLELTNIGRLPIKLTCGMRICQLVLENLSSPAEVPYGAKKGAKYFNESGASQSKEDDLKKS